MSITGIYAPLLARMRGQTVMIEVGDVTRQAAEVIKGWVWDLFQDDEILLMVILTTDQLDKPSDVIEKEAAIYKQQVATQNALPPGQPRQSITPPSTKYKLLDWNFKWVLTKNIIAVTSDLGVRLNQDLRSTFSAKEEPLYRDNADKWHLINNFLVSKVQAKLAEMGLQSNYSGPFRDVENKLVDKTQAEIPVVAKPTQPTIQLGAGPAVQGGSVATTGGKVPTESVVNPVLV